MSSANHEVRDRPRWVYLAALLAGNFALALGPWSVRLADSGPVSAGFWRLALAIPLLALLARREGQALGGFSAKTWAAIVAAGVFFALDLASWHVGIGQTRLGNATLFGNAGSVILMAWGLIAARRGPRAFEALGILSALVGARASAQLSESATSSFAVAAANVLPFDAEGRLIGAPLPA